MGHGVLDQIPAARMWGHDNHRRIRTTEDRGLEGAACHGFSAERDPCPVSRRHTPTYVGAKGHASQTHVARKKTRGYRGRAGARTHTRANIRV